MNKNTELLIAGVIIVALAALVVSNFLRRLRYKERMLKWEMRYFFHLGVVLVVIAGGAYLYFAK